MIMFAQSVEGLGLALFLFVLFITFNLTLFCFVVADAGFTSCAVAAAAFVASFALAGFTVATATTQF